MRPFQCYPPGQTGQLTHDACESYRCLLGDERVGLGHVANACLHRSRLGVAVETQDRCASRGRFVEPEQGTDQRRLAGPVRAQQPNRRAISGRAQAGQVPELQDVPPAQLHMEVVDFDDRCHGVRLARVSASVQIDGSSRIRRVKRTRLWRKRPYGTRFLSTGSAPLGAERAGHAHLFAFPSYHYEHRIPVVLRGSVFKIVRNTQA